jgi:hypothetical protein
VRLGYPSKAPLLQFHLGHIAYAWAEANLPIAREASEGGGGAGWEGGGVALMDLAEVVPPTEAATRDRRVSGCSLIVS